MMLVKSPENPFISRPPGGFWGRGARGGTSHTESGKCEIGRARALSPLSRLPGRGGWGGLARGFSLSLSPCAGSLTERILSLQLSLSSSQLLSQLLSGALSLSWPSQRGG